MGGEMKSESSGEKREEKTSKKTKDELGANLKPEESLAASNGEASASSLLREGAVSCGEQMPSSESAPKAAATDPEASPSAFPSLPLPENMPREAVMPQPQAPYQKVPTEDGQATVPSPSQPQPQLVPPTPTEIRRRWRERVDEYRAVRAPELTDEQVDKAFEFYEGIPEGYTKMWFSLIKRFGPELSKEEKERLKWRNKVKHFYALFDPVRTDKDVEECIRHFERKPDGFAQMWRRLQHMYGVNLASQAGREERSPRATSPRESASAPQRRSVQPGVPAVVVDDDTAELRRRGSAAESSCDTPPTVLMLVVVAGVSMRLYQNAGPAHQHKFNSCVAREIQDLLQFQGQLLVTSVANQGEGVLYELEALLPNGWSAAHIGSQLTRKVLSGSCSVALIRQAYGEMLRGDPQRIFLMDAAVVEYRATPGLRATVRISTKKHNAGTTSCSTAAALLASSGDPSPLSSSQAVQRSLFTSEAPYLSGFPQANGPQLGVDASSRNSLLRREGPQSDGVFRQGLYDSGPSQVQPYEPPLLLQQDRHGAGGADPFTFSSGSPGANYPAMTFGSFSSPYSRATTAKTPAAFSSSSPQFDTVDTVEELMARTSRHRPVSDALNRAADRTADSGYSNERKAYRASLDAHMRRGFL